MTPPERPSLALLRIAHNWGVRGTALKAVSFAMVGVVNASVDFGVFSFAYFYLGLPIIAANLLAWIVAVTGSYILNSQITFAVESGRKLRLRDYLTFLLTQLGGLIVNTTTVYVLSWYLHVLLAKALAILASFIVNFSLSNFVVFRRREDVSR